VLGYLFLPCVTCSPTRQPCLVAVWPLGSRCRFEPACGAGGAVVLSVADVPRRTVAGCATGCSTYFMPSCILYALGRMFCTNLYPRCGIRLCGKCIRFCLWLPPHNPKKTAPPPPLCRKYRLSTHFSAAERLPGAPAAHRLSPTAGWRPSVPEARRTAGSRRRCWRWRAACRPLPPATADGGGGRCACDRLYGPVSQADCPQRRQNFSLCGRPPWPIMQGEPHGE
jgi:hypothetical protein